MVMLLVCFLLMVASTYVAYFDNIEDNCYVDPLSMGLMAWEESFILVVYMQLVYRMLHIHNRLEKQAINLACLV